MAEPNVLRDWVDIITEAPKIFKDESWTMSFILTNKDNYHVHIAKLKWSIYRGKCGVFHITKISKACKIFFLGGTNTV